MNDVVWSYTALVQVDFIGAYIEQFNPKAAGGNAAALTATGNSLGNSTHPERPVVRTTMRELAIVHPNVYDYSLQIRIGALPPLMWPQML